MKTISDLLLPLLILLLLLAAGWKGLDALEGFIRGARQGMEVAVRVLPNLAGMLCAIALMRESGLLGLLCHICAPVLTRLGLPAEVAPLVLVRPLSGSASAGHAGDPAGALRPGQRRGHDGLHRHGFQRDNLLHAVRVFQRGEGQTGGLCGCLFPCGNAGRGLAGGTAAQRRLKALKTRVFPLTARQKPL